jgi:hypothetical protein
MGLGIDEGNWLTLWVLESHHGGATSRRATLPESDSDINEKQTSLYSGLEFSEFVDHSIV